MKRNTTRRTEFIDHKNNIFQSLDEMCNYWNVSKGTYQDRYRKHWSTEECLTGRKRVTARYIDCIDHKGNKFSSVKEMCDYWNIKYSTFLGRRRRGYSIEEALTYAGNDNQFQVKDHLGNIFSSIDEICNHYGITVSMYYQRLNKGWSLEKTLTTRPRYKKKRLNESKIERTDHNGTTYKSVKDMCKNHGIETLTYLRRLERGWDKEQALTQEIDTTKHGMQMVDPYGKTYPMLKDMLNAYSINMSTYQERNRKGYSLAECLGIVPLLNDKIKDYKVNDNFVILEEIEETNDDAKLFFLCIVNGHEVIMRRENVINYCLNAS
jgi:hypothetical protein